MLEAFAMDVAQTDVRREGNRYTLEVAARFSAPPGEIRAVITDFDHLDRIHPMVISSERVGEAANGVQRVRIENHACMLMLCYTLIQMTDFQTVENGDLRATVDPTESDYNYGRLEWRLKETPGRGTALVFVAELEPDIWIPPVVGPWLLERKLRRLAIRITENLNRLATQGT